MCLSKSGSINETDPDLIGTTESWANGWTVFRKARVGHRGGGVILHFRNSIPFVQIRTDDNAVILVITGLIN